MFMTMSGKASSLPGGRKIRNESNERTADSASFRIIVSSCKPYAWFPEFDEIVNEWGKIMIECSKWRFPWSRNNTSKEHVFSSEGGRLRQTSDMSPIEVFLSANLFIYGLKKSTQRLNV